jgi:CO/xanthine dehydrogenase Mo-binding subunit
MPFTIKVNGNTHNVDVDGDTPLLWVLRDVLGMTGTKFGCGRALCGACTVHLDGSAVRSCVTTIDSVGSTEITTIEAIEAVKSGSAPRAIARVQKAAADTTGLALDKVVVHNHLLGGGFGRRLESDGPQRVVQIAMQVKGPVKVVWTREEDIQHDMYRPHWFDRLSAGLDDQGRPVAWTNRFAGPSIIARYLPPAFKKGLDPDTTEGAIDLVYSFPNLRVEYARVEHPGIPTAFWRSVGPSHNVFVTESFVDELAAAAKQDAVYLSANGIGIDGGAAVKRANDASDTHSTFL